MTPREPRRLPADVTAILLRTVKAADNDPDPVQAARTIARGTTIVGLMLEDLSDQRHAPGKKFAGWLTWVGRILWGMVELAAPRSLGEVLFQYWIWLIYALAGTMILIGSVTGGEGVVRAGVITALFAVAAHLAVGILRNWLHRRPQLFGGWVPVVVSVAALIGLVYALAQMQNSSPLSEPEWRHLDSQNAGKLLGNLHDSDPQLARNAQANFASAYLCLKFRWLAVACFLLTFGAAAARMVEGMVRRQWALGLILLLAVSTAIAAGIANVSDWIALIGVNWELPDTTVATYLLAAATACAVAGLGALAAINRRRMA